MSLSSDNQMDTWDIAQLRIHALKLDIENIVTLVNKSDLINAIVLKESNKPKTPPITSKKSSSDTTSRYSPIRIGASNDRISSAPITPAVISRINRINSNPRSLFTFPTIEEVSIGGILIKNMSFSQLESQLISMYDKQIEYLFKFRSMPYWIDRTTVIKLLVKSVLNSEPQWHFFGNPPLTIAGMSRSTSIDYKDEIPTNPYIYYGTINEYQTFTLVDLESSFANEKVDSSLNQYKIKFYIPQTENKSEFPISSIKQLKSLILELNDNSIKIFEPLVSKIDQGLSDNQKITSYLRDIRTVYLTLSDEAKSSFEIICVSFFLLAIYTQNTDFKFPNIVDDEKNTDYIKQSISHSLGKFRNKELIEKLFIIDYNLSTRNPISVSQNSFILSYNKGNIQEISVDIIKTFYSIFYHIFLWNDEQINNSLSAYISKPVVFITRR